MFLNIPVRNNAVNFSEHGYEVEDYVGKGQFGRAFRVRHLEEQTTWVAKAIDLSILDERDKLFSLQEAAVMQTLNHPGIVGWRESFVHEDMYLVIIMEYCELGDLASQMEIKKANGEKALSNSTERKHAHKSKTGSAKRNSTVSISRSPPITTTDSLPPETGDVSPSSPFLSNDSCYSENEVLSLITQLAEALHYIHSRSILHRDIKPQNIFLTGAGVVKIGDFGISRMFAHAGIALASTTVGTPQYMSPEMCESKPYTYKSDIWAFGCVVYEMAALRPAFDAPSFLSLVLTISTKQPAPLDSARYSPELQELVFWLLAKLPEERPSAADVLREPAVQKSRLYNAMESILDGGDNSPFACDGNRSPSLTNNAKRTAASCAGSVTAGRDWADLRSGGGRNAHVATTVVGSKHGRRRSLGLGSLHSALGSDGRAPARGPGAGRKAAVGFRAQHRSVVLARIYQALQRAGCIAHNESLSRFFSYSRSGSFSHDEPYAAENCSRPESAMSEDASPYSRDSVLLPATFLGYNVEEPLTEELIRNIVLHCGAYVSKSEILFLRDKLTLMDGADARSMSSLASFLIALQPDEWSDAYATASSEAKAGLSLASYAPRQSKRVVRLRLLHAFRAFAQHATGDASVETVSCAAFRAVIHIFFPELTAHELEDMAIFAPKATALDEQVNYLAFLLEVDLINDQELRLPHADFFVGRMEEEFFEGAATPDVPEIPTELRNFRDGPSAHVEPNGFSPDIASNRSGDSASPLTVPVPQYRHDRCSQPTGSILRPKLKPSAERSRETTLKWLDIEAVKQVSLQDQNKASHRVSPAPIRRSSLPMSDDDSSARFVDAQSNSPTSPFASARVLSLEMTAEADVAMIHTPGYNNTTPQVLKSALKMTLPAPAANSVSVRQPHRSITSPMGPSPGKGSPFKHYHIAGDPMSPSFSRSNAERVNFRQPTATRTQKHNDEESSESDVCTKDNSKGNRAKARRNLASRRASVAASVYCEAPVEQQMSTIKPENFRLYNHPIVAQRQNRAASIDETDSPFGPNRAGANQFARRLSRRKLAVSVSPGVGRGAAMRDMSETLTFEPGMSSPTTEFAGNPDAASRFLLLRHKNSGSQRSGSKKKGITNFQTGLNDPHRTDEFVPEPTNGVLGAPEEYQGSRRRIRSEFLPIHADFGADVNDGSKDLIEQRRATDFAVGSFRPTSTLDGSTTLIVPLGGLSVDDDADSVASFLSSQPTVSVDGRSTVASPNDHTVTYPNDDVPKILILENQSQSKISSNKNRTSVDGPKRIMRTELHVPFTPQTGRSLTPSSRGSVRASPVSRPDRFANGVMSSQRLNLRKAVEERVGAVLAVQILVHQLQVERAMSCRAVTSKLFDPAAAKERALTRLLEQRQKTDGSVGGSERTLALSCHAQKALLGAAAAREGALFTELLNEGCRLLREGVATLALHRFSVDRLMAPPKTDGSRDAAEDSPWGALSAGNSNSPFHKSSTASPCGSDDSVVLDSDDEVADLGGDDEEDESAAVEVWSSRFLLITQELTTAISQLLSWTMQIVSLLRHSPHVTFDSANQLKELISSQVAFISCKTASEHLRNDWDAARFFMGLVVARKSLTSSIPLAASPSGECDSGDGNRTNSAAILADMEAQMLHSTGTDPINAWRRAAFSVVARLQQSALRTLRELLSTLQLEMSFYGTSDCSVISGELPSNSAFITPVPRSFRSRRSSTPNLLTKHTPLSANAANSAIANSAAMCVSPC